MVEEVTETSLILRAIMSFFVEVVDILMAWKSAERVDGLIGVWSILLWTDWRVFL